MKKIIACIIAGIMTAGSFVSCSNSSESDSAKLNIVCTIFPQYDWVREILGEQLNAAEITLLTENGVDLHNYMSTVGDMIKISTCDVFIYVGGESDGWVTDALNEAANTDMVVVNLTEVLGDMIKEEELVEGMQEHEDGESGHDEIEYDEHVWLSLKNAEVICRYLADKLGEADSENADAYKANSDAYIIKLQELDSKYRQTVGSAKRKIVLFGDRFPFRYLTDDYGLNYYAAFAGCSAETEASFETIAFLSGKIDELGLTSVLTIEGTNHRIAETIVQNTKDKNQKIIVMDSMQSTTSRDIKNGTTYLSVMEKNLDILKSALN